MQKQRVKKQAHRCCFRWNYEYKEEPGAANQTHLINWRAESVSASINPRTVD